MTRSQVAVVVFACGVFSLVVHSTLPFVWAVAGIEIPYPLVPQGSLAVIQAFTPPLGLVTMLAAGLIYGGRRKEAAS